MCIKFCTQKSLVKNWKNGLNRKLANAAFEITL